MGRVVEGNQLELEVGAVLLHPGPKIHQELGRRHGGGADADYFLALLHGAAGPRDGVVAVLNDVARILVETLARRGKLQAPMGAHEELQAQVLFQQVDLLDDRRRRDVQPFGGFVEAAGVRHAQKCIELRVIHTDHRPFESLVLLYRQEKGFVKAQRSKSKTKVCLGGHTLVRGKSEIQRLPAASV